MSRESRRVFYKEKERYARRLDNYYDELMDAWGTLPKIKLEAPVRSGWIRYFVLREDLKNNSTKMRVFNKILSKINSTVHSRNKTFTYKTYKKEIKPIKQDLRVLSEKEYVGLEPNEKKYFYMTWRRTFQNGPLVKAYVFVEPTAFEYRIKPYYITEVPAHDGDLESALDWVRKQLYDKMLYRKYVSESSDIRDCYHDLKKAKVKLEEKEWKKELKS